jgi:nitrile hydratase
VIAERSFPPGARVWVGAGDPPGHTRAPRYVRGHVGEIVEQHGAHPLPDAVVAGWSDPPVEPVYAVRFDAAELFPGDEADHTVVVTLWHSYLQPAP